MISLKRKHSSQELHAFSSSSPAKFIDTDGSQISQSTRQSLHPSRTRKRHRNNRPLDSDVYVEEHTLSLLFSAQQNLSFPPVNFSNHQNSSQAVSIPSKSIHSSNQALLSSLWNCPSIRQPPLSCPAAQPAYNPLNKKTSIPSYFQMMNCEDCDAPIDFQEITVDNEGNDHTCASCGKCVCQSCSISYIDMERKCLICVGKIP
ncbi:putative orf21 protein [Erysiphe neolycopersici]|uniref:Putative orf21 protein n=1 Tax=Erysiphe neolycopersici TaxID=212602 RepID=A0A420HMD4_9PEZI|nr:putative orf21 protein [Erysiphe neolycopersici]